MKTNTEIQNAQIGTLIQEFTGQAVAFYDGMKEQPVCRPAKEATLEHLEKQTIPAEGRPVQEVYSEMLRDIYSNTILGQHPRSFSCVPSTASLLSWMGDVMTGFYNPHASCRVNGPAAGLVEKKLINWMCGLAGYPKTSGGLFVSGGSMANLTALTAARDQKLTYEERSRAVIYVSGQTHASVAKGLHIIGFRKDQIRVIPVDSLFRMDITALRVAILNDRKEGRIPFAVIASAGTTNTGSVDPMHDIAALCKEFDMYARGRSLWSLRTAFRKIQRKIVRNRIFRQHELGRSQMDAPDIQLQRSSGAQRIHAGAQLRRTSGIFKRCRNLRRRRGILGFGYGADTSRPRLKTVDYPADHGKPRHGRSHQSWMRHGRTDRRAAPESPGLGNHFPCAAGSHQFPLCAAWKHDTGRN